MSTLPAVLRMFHRSLYTCAPILLAGCSGSSDVSTDTAIRDSAGVRIINHGVATLAELPEWLLDSTPQLMIGGDSVHSPFSNIRDAVQRRDGDVIVADAVLGDIRQFRADGQFVRIIARRGRGPGEVGFVRALQLLGNDSLAFFDGSNRRTSVFDSTGTFARQIVDPVVSPQTRVGVSALRADGTLLGSVRAAFVPAPANRDSVYRTPFVIAILRASTDSASVAVDTVMVAPDAEAYRDNTTEEGEVRADEYALRFGRRTTFASNTSRLIVATNERDAEILVFDRDVLTQRILAALPATPLTDAEVKPFFNEMQTMLEKSPRPPSARQEVLRMLENVRNSPVRPPIGRLFLGGDHSVWVEAEWITTNEARRYVVFDSLGLAVARVSLPSGVRPLRLSLQHILATQMNADDMPQIGRWTWTRKNNDR